MKYTEEDIRRATGIKACMAGEIYKKQGRVLSIVKDKTGILSKVHGNERQPYKQHIQIHKVQGKIEISGECTCPVGFNCKHVAAALIEGMGHVASTVTSSGKRSISLAPTSLSSSLSSSDKSDIIILGGPVASTELPFQLTSWIDSLEKAELTASEDYPDTINSRMIYVIEPLIVGSTKTLGIKPMSVRVRKDGGVSTAGSFYKPENAFSNAPPKHLRPSDVRILKALSGLDYELNYTILSLESENGAAILPDILATGRARWLATNGIALQLGEPQSGDITWEPAEAGTMLPQLQLGDGLLGFNATPPIYVDVQAGTVGFVTTDLLPKIACTLLKAPPVPLEYLTKLSDKLMQRLPKLAKIHPKKLGAHVPIESAPIPILKLFCADLPVQAMRREGYYFQNTDVAKESISLARLSFRYGPCEINLDEVKAKPLVAHKGQIYELFRDSKREGAAHKTLQAHGFVPVSEERSNVPAEHIRDFVPVEGELAWFDLIYHDIPKLQAEGFEVHISPDFPFHLIRGDGEVEAKFNESSGIDWLELGVGVMVDGERIDLIDPIVSMIMKGTFDPNKYNLEEPSDKPIYLPLNNGRFIALPAIRFAPIIKAIYELASGGNALAKGGKIKLSIADAAAIGEFEALTAFSGIVWRGGDNIRSMGRKLTAANGIPQVVLPASFKADLRPYQLDGVSWLSFLRDVGLGGILADDMGLGKTVQALALLAIEKEAGRLTSPALVVAPTSLMANWRRESEKFTPDFKVLTLQGADRKDKFDDIPNSDLVLTTYPLVARDHEFLVKHKWHIMFLDEAQTIKNPDASTTKLITSLDAQHRFCLTGTPLENHLGELWSLFAFASPGFLGDRAHFTKNWRTAIEKQGNSERGRLLAKRVKPFMLRRTKNEVATDLPPKTEIIERIDMEAAQRDIYESIRLSMHQKVRDAIAEKGFARSRIVILDALLKLRQTCCDPRLLKLQKNKSDTSSAKLDRLQELMVELLDEGRKIIVFSQFTSMLELIRAELDKQDTRYSLLTGQTKDRETEIRNFQEGDIPVFLISLKAGGTGLNLTAADTIILYDPWWNPAVEEQAIDRAHRIGQEKPVFVHKLVINGTIEEKMEALKEKKRALAASIFDVDGSPTLAMTEADLDMLFME
jgi:superfamily II DNA or RNA helicase